MKKALGLTLVLLTLLSLAACSANPSSAATPPAAAAAAEAATSAAAETTAAVGGTYANLSGHSLLIYCGAGMTDPFSEIVSAFEKETGCTMEVTYANAGQDQTQIKTAQEGDLFIAGSADELKPVSDFISGQTDLVKHIPVLAVAAGNPKQITCLKDLTTEGVAVVLGDGESTPIGKIADKALAGQKITEEVEIIARSATAPAVANALITSSCDAVIVWKENAAKDAIEIVGTTDLDPFVKTVPAASLSFSKDEAARSEFLAFLASYAAKAIWAGYGYESMG